MKICSKCKQAKDESEFCKDKSRSDGLNHRCKQCCKEIQQNSLKNKEYHKKYYQEHKSEYNKRSAIWRENNRELLNERFKTRYRQNQTDYIVNKRHTDPLFHLYSNFASNMRMSLKTLTSGTVSKNGKSWEDLVGYSLQDLKEHLESLFQPGMTWENYGQWHIDHIKPVSSFNITSLDCDDFKACWSLKNLQPLWAKDNIRKSNNIGPEWNNN